MITQNIPSVKNKNNNLTFESKNKYFELSSGSSVTFIGVKKMPNQYSVYSEIEINSSAEHIWEIISDFSKYHLWNTLIPSANGILKKGNHVQMHICPPGLMSRKVQVKLGVVDAKRELNWMGRTFFPGLLDGDHSFLILSTDTNKVVLIQKESFSGFFVPFVSKWLMPKMQTAFESMNNELKKYAEKRQA